MESVSFTVNGAEVAVSADHPHLLSALREDVGVTSPKDGCAPSGQCGACTVLVDGKAIQSCLVSMEKAADTEVLTLEGFTDDERKRLADAYAATGALQCGFCTPGLMVRTKWLLDTRGKDLDRDTVKSRLGAHLCRCTGYTKILEAVDLLVDEVDVEIRTPSAIGDGGVKYEAAELALGDRGYVDDIRPEGLLFGALKLTDHARADIVGIDTSRAEAAEGVVAVFTAADVPGQMNVGIIHEDWPVFIGEGERTSFYGDVLAIVVAETKQQARDATDLVDVYYHVLPPFANAHDALDSDEDAVWDLDGNVLSRSVYSRGDVDEALAASAHTVHEVFRTQRVEHAFLEPESTLAVPTDEGLHVYSGGQGVWDDRNQIAKVLDVEPQTITVELVSNGGAFGGKEDMSNQGQTALAAHLLQRPVACTLTREQSFRMHAKRHPIEIEVSAGCDADGKLTALRSRMVGDSV